MQYFYSLQAINFLRTTTVFHIQAQQNMKAAISCNKRMSQGSMTVNYNYHATDVTGRHHGLTVQ